MVILEMSINKNYCRDWDAWQGLRELVSNGRDEEIENGHMLTVTYVNKILRIENEGAKLTRDALLLGSSSKMDRTDTIGKFGEGLAIGIMALVRGGRGVKIRTGSEVWNALIERSDRYDADVLKFDCKGGNDDKKRVRVEVTNVTEDDWKGLRERFLFLVKWKKDERIQTERGDLLLSDRFRGKVFVRGVYVQDNPELAYGYNLKHAEIDRDRKMIDSWNMQWETARIWNEALAQRPDLQAVFYAMVSEARTDVAGLQHNASSTSKNVQGDIAARFLDQFGKDALPVSNMAESAEVAHLGKRGIVVSKPLGAMLAEVIGSKDTVLKATREEIVRMLSWDDMLPEHRDNLLGCIELISNVRPACTLDMIDIVDFRSTNLLGQFKTDAKRMAIASRLLGDRDELLATIVHEFSHLAGGDGTKEHVMAIENLWRDIVKSLRGAA